MGQTSSSEVSNCIYVPVYRRPKWANQDWDISMDTRPMGAMGLEKGFTKHELQQFTKRLKAKADMDETDAYIKHELHSLIERLKTAADSQQKSPLKRSRFQRTINHIRTIRTRSPSSQRGERHSGTHPQTGTQSGSPSHQQDDNTPSSPLLPPGSLAKQDPSVKTVSSSGTPQNVQSSHLECRQRLIRLAGHLKPSLEEGLDKEICEDVNRIIEDTQWYLRRTYKAFKDVVIVSMGSIADGTKIIAADEFDLVILLPALEQSISQIEVLKDTDNEFIRLKLSNKKDSDKYKHLHDNVNEENSENLLKLAMDALQSFLRKGWKIVSTETKSFVTRIHLDREIGNKMRAVRLDISLALPVLSNKISPLDLNNPEDLLKLPLWNQLQSALQQFDGKIFALIHSKSRDSLKRISLAIAEKEQLHRYGATGGPVQCLSLCKILVALFFPLVYADGSWEAYIPPYLLKNAIFYLMEHYNSKEHWDGEEIYLRVVEVFMLVKKSLWADDFSSRGSRISLFVFPGVTTFPEFCNDSCRFDPKEQQLTDSLPHSFSEGTLTYPCRFPFSDDLGILMEHSESKRICFQYFQRLGNTDWKFREILNDFITIVKTIFDFKGLEPWALGENNNNINQVT